MVGQTTAYDVNTNWTGSTSLYSRCTSIWKFNESSGNVANDEKGVSRLINTGSPTWAAGLLNNCTQLNGTMLWRCEAPAESPIFVPGTDDYGFFGWVWITTKNPTVGSFDFIYCKNTGASDRLALYIRDAGVGGQRRFTVQSGVTVLMEGVDMPLGVWVFVWVRRIAGELQAGWTQAGGVFSAVPRLSATDASSAGNNSYYFEIGGQGAGGYWTGKFDILGWMNGAAPTMADLTSAYNAGVGTEDFSFTNRQVGEDLRPAITHINELRTEIVALASHIHSYAAINTGTPIPAVPAPGAAVTIENRSSDKANITALRASLVALDLHEHTWSAETTTGGPNIFTSWADATLTAQLRIKREHINDLRNALEGLDLHTHTTCSCECACTCTCTGTCGCTCTCTCQCSGMMW